MTVDAPEHVTPRPERRRRRPGPPASAPWRWAYPVLLVGLAVLTLVLSATGARLVLDSRDGQVGRSELDPTKPGYLATVPATPLLLVVHADEDELYGVTLLALGADDKGGAAVFLSPDTIVQPGERSTLAEIYEDDGVDNISTGLGLRSSLSALFHADINSAIELDATSMAPLIEPVAPLTFQVTKAVKVTSKGKTTTVLDAGEAELSTPDEIAAAIETLGNGETPADRAGRQIAFWSAWINAVQSHQDGAFPVGSETTELARFMTGLAAAPPLTTPLPTVPYGGAVVANTDRLAIDLPTIIPYPRQENVRLNVAVLNGVGDQTLNTPMERALVAANAQIASRGNPDSFGVAKTSVVYHDPTVKDDAEALAKAIGATDVRFEEKVDSEIQVTVTIGADFDPKKPVATTTTSSSTSTGAPR